jgi:hypothetical protein
MMFEIQQMGRDVYVRPTDGQWQTAKGSDNRDWIELSREKAAYLAACLQMTDRFTVTQDDEDG